VAPTWPTASLARLSAALLWFHIIIIVELYYMRRIGDVIIGVAAAGAVVGGDGAVSGLSAGYWQAGGHCLHHWLTGKRVKALHPFQSPQAEANGPRGCEGVGSPTPYTP